MTRGRCHYCDHPAVAIAGPENHKPRRVTQLGNVRAVWISTDLRVGYLIEAADGHLLDKPLLVCGPCLFFALPSNIAA